MLLNDYKVKNIYFIKQVLYARKFYLFLQYNF